MTTVRNVELDDKTINIIAWIIFQILQENGIVVNVIIFTLFKSIWSPAKYEKKRFNIISFLFFTLLFQALNKCVWYLIYEDFDCSGNFLALSRRLTTWRRWITNWKDDCATSLILSKAQEYNIVLKNGKKMMLLTTVVSWKVPFRCVLLISLQELTTSGAHWQSQNLPRFSSISWIFKILNFHLNFELNFGNLQIGQDPSVYSSVMEAVAVLKMAALHVLCIVSIRSKSAQSSNVIISHIMC